MLKVIAGREAKVFFAPNVTGVCVAAKFIRGHIYIIYGQISERGKELW
jgi:hypothetical protein